MGAYTDNQFLPPSHSHAKLNSALSAPSHRVSHTLPKDSTLRSHNARHPVLACVIRLLSYETHRSEQYMNPGQDILRFYFEQNKLYSLSFHRHLFFQFSRARYNEFMIASFEKCSFVNSLALFTMLDTTSGLSSRYSIFSIMSERSSFTGTK